MATQRKLMDVESHATALDGYGLVRRFRRTAAVTPIQSRTELEMLGKTTTLVLGLGAGYVLGTKAGRARYEQTKPRVDRFAKHAGESDG